MLRAGRTRERAAGFAAIRRVVNDRPWQLNASPLRHRDVRCRLRLLGKTGLVSRRRECNRQAFFSVWPEYLFTASAKPRAAVSPLHHHPNHADCALSQRRETVNVRDIPVPSVSIS
jgi:hypothetical protein